MKYINFIIASLFLASIAQAQSFGLNLEQFKSSFNAQAKAESNYPNMAATIIELKELKKNIYSAKINDGPFKQMVKKWKEMDLANGNFQLKDRLSITTDSSGKIAKVQAYSDRADMNLFHFLGTFSNIIRTFNKDMTDAQVQSAIKEVGLMKGNTDPTIGKSLETFTKGAAITCLSQPSNVTTEVSCAFTPCY